MRSSGKFFIPFIMIAVLIVLAGCTQSVKPTARADAGLMQQLPTYSGPRARVAVAKFQWKVGGYEGHITTIKGASGEDITISHEYGGVATGLKDMLTTALVQSNRYRVLERQEFGAIKEEISLGKQGYVERSTAIEKGYIKGADLIVVAAVTGWEPGTSDTGGGAGGGSDGLLGGVFGSVRKSSMAMDIRIIDTATSEILAATRVEGEATDIDLGALAGGLTGDIGIGGFLSTYAKTPMEKAIRIAINEAAKYIVTTTPPQYLKY